jgi:lactoylglutathione lyase
MKFEPIHINFDVKDLERSVAFYKEALGFEIKRVRGIRTYVGPEDSSFELELCCPENPPEGPVGLGVHYAFRVDDFEGALKKHEEMGCICRAFQGAGPYFIADPDGYVIEILPAAR